MLEQDLTELFELQAGEEPPPAQASIAAAARHGRTRLRRRRTLSIAAPLLAVITVLAIALTGTLVAPAPAPAPAPTRPAQGQSLPRQPHEVPPLFFWPGWLPAGMRVQSGVVSSRHAETLYVTGNPGWDVGAYTKGICTLKPSVLVCARAASHPVDGRAGTINGLPAYWSGGRRLLFERAPDQWATVSFPTHADDLRVAAHLTAHVPTIRYPAQLTGRWPGLNLQYAAFDYVHGQAVVTEFAYQPGRTPRADQRDPTQNTAAVSASPASSSGSCRPNRRSRSEILDGHRVYVSRIGDVQGLCAPDADGLEVSVAVTGTRPFASATRVFAQLRLFGRRTANWPSTPFH